MLWQNSQIVAFGHFQGAFGHFQGAYVKDLFI